MAISLIVEARGNRAVVLRALRPVLVEGSWSSVEGLPYRQLSRMPERRFDVSYRDDELLIRAQRGRYFRRMAHFPFKVTPLDPELFELHVDVPVRCTFGIVLDWTCAGREGSMDVTDEYGFPRRF